MDKRTCTIVKERITDMIYSKKEIVEKVDSLKGELVRETTVRKKTDK